MVKFVDDQYCTDAHEASDVGWCAICTCVMCAPHDCMTGFGGAHRSRVCLSDVTYAGVDERGGGNRGDIQETARRTIDDRDARAYGEGGLVHVQQPG